MALGKPLRPEEWAVLLDVAAGGDGWYPAAPYGRLMMRGLVAADAQGGSKVTAVGLAALVERAHCLFGCVEGTTEDEELARISEVLDGHGV